MHSDPGSLDRTGNTAWEARHRCVGAAVGDAGSGCCMQVGQPASLLCLSNNTCINQVFGASPAPPRFTAVAPQRSPSFPLNPLERVRRVRLRTAEELPPGTDAPHPRVPLAARRAERASNGLSLLSNE